MRVEVGDYRVGLGQRSAPKYLLKFMIKVAVIQHSFQSFILIFLLMVHEVHRNPNQIDDPFRSANVAKEFFRRKDRSRSYEMQDVIGVR